jgi:hypothetical protein
MIKAHCLSVDELKQRAHDKKPVQWHKEYKCSSRTTYVGDGWDKQIIIISVKRMANSKYNVELKVDNTIAERIIDSLGFGAQTKVPMFSDIEQNIASDGKICSCSSPKPVRLLTSITCDNCGKRMT